jgi:hypothetical protein
MSPAIPAEEPAQAGITIQTADGRIFDLESYVLAVFSAGQAEPEALAVPKELAIAGVVIDGGEF